jgi:aminopeptidase N
MSMLGSNERIHPWLDEGMNSYFEYRYAAKKYRSHSVFGDKIPAEVKKLSEEDFQFAIYKALQQIPIQNALETPSADYKSSEEYGMTAYLKGAMWMYLLEQTIGREKVDQGFQNYFRLWKFKHPKPNDMKAAFEQAVNARLTQFFSLLDKEGAL